MPDYGLDLEFGILPSPDALLAHLSHEEEALHDPLALHGFG